MISLFLSLPFILLTVFFFLLTPFNPPPFFLRILPVSLLCPLASFPLCPSFSFSFGPTSSLLSPLSACAALSSSSSSRLPLPSPLRHLSSDPPHLGPNPALRRIHLGGRQLRAWVQRPHLPPIFPPRSPSALSVTPEEDGKSTLTSRLRHPLLHPFHLHLRHFLLLRRRLLRLVSSLHPPSPLLSGRRASRSPRAEPFVI